MAGQRKEAFVEGRLAMMVVLEYGSFLVVDQHLAGQAVKPLEAADQGFVGVFRVAGWGSPYKEAA